MVQKVLSEQPQNLDSGQRGFSSEQDHLLCLSSSGTAGRCLPGSVSSAVSVCVGGDLGVEDSGCRRYWAQHWGPRPPISSRCCGDQ